MLHSDDDFGPETKSPARRRGLAEKLWIFGLSALPIIGGVLLARIKLLRFLVAVLEMPFMIGIGIMGGFYWYRLVTGQITSKARAELAERGIEPTDGISLVTAFIVGFGLVLILMELNTHEMVRAFTGIWNPPFEE